MSKINDLLIEAKTKVASVTALTNRVAIAYNEEDLFDTLKGVKGYPAAGVVYEGMRSIPQSVPTHRAGVSAEVVIAIIIVQQGDAISATAQKRTGVLDLLENVREKFLGKRSTVTSHIWNFMVEAPAELKSGMVCWVQRWSVPLQLPQGPITP